MEGRYSGKCGAELFVKWACEIRYYTIFEKKPKSLYKSFSGATARNFIEHKKGIFVAAEHGEHVHVIHDCQYTNSQCRIIRHISEQDS